MMEKTNSRHTSHKRFSQRSLLGGLGWVGGIGLLSSGGVFAQTPPTADALAVPSAQELLAPVIQPDSVAAPAAPAPTITPDAPTVEFASPAPDPSPQSTTPLQAPVDTATDAPITLPSQMADQMQTLTPGGDSYIDTTDYSLGATPSHGQPSVVLSERSTGCQVVLKSGQDLPASLCATHAVATGRRPGSVNSVTVGPISFSSNGIGIARNYYSLTQRPAGLPGNGNIRLMFPLSMPSAITSAFGWRIHPITGALRFHYGTDLGAPMGTPVLAAYTGRVTTADFLRGYGLTVVMRHSDPTAETLYAHLSELFVQSGDWVEQGQVIGRVGSTGNSTGPHLHFEFRERTSEGWVALNPGGLLEQAIANFSQQFHLAQAPAKPGTQLIAFDLDGFDKLLKVLNADPTTLEFQLVQLGETPIAFDFDLEDVKEWNKLTKGESQELEVGSR